MTSSQDRWEHFAHQADIGIRGIGGSKEAAFVQAGLALTAVITTPDTIVPQEAVSVTCEAPDEEALLVAWLNALVYEMATRHMLFRRFEVHIVDGHLTGTAWGEPVNVDRHQPAVEVKGATYTKLRVAHQEDGAWVAECVVDV